MSNDVTDEMLHEAIDSLDNEFDSHDVIVHVMRHHPQQYTRDLHSHVSADDPIQTYHATIGKRLLSLGALDKTDRQITTNVRSGVTQNQGWRKRSPK